jgi:hypothetical protein
MKDSATIMAATLMVVANTEILRIKVENAFLSPLISLFAMKNGKFKLKACLVKIQLNY